MKRTPLAVIALSAWASLLALAPACKDDSTVNSEPPLPGPGPIGMGGFSAAGSGGAAGAGATGGSAGTANGGAGGEAAGAAGAGGASAGSAGASAGGSAGASAGGAAGNGAGGAAGGGNACPTGGDAKVRFGNVTPAAGTLDFCLTSGTTTIGPVFKCAGGTSLAYKDVSKQLAIPSGTYDIATTSGADCSALGTPLKGVAIAGTMTIVASSYGVSSFHDSAVTPGDQYLRFIHAVKGAGALDVGVADSPTLPSNISLPVFAAIAPGKTSTASTTPDGQINIDPNGYLVVTPTYFLTDTFVAAAPAGSLAGILATHICLGDCTMMGGPNYVNKVFTAYGIGSQGDGAFPLAALICDEGATSGNLTACAIP